MRLLENFVILWHLHSSKLRLRQVILYNISIGLAKPFPILYWRAPHILTELTGKIFLVGIAALHSYCVNAHNGCAEQISGKHDFFIYAVLNVTCTEAFFVYRSEISHAYAQPSACRVNIGSVPRVCNNSTAQLKQTFILRELFS